MKKNQTININLKKLLQHAFLIADTLNIDTMSKDVYNDKEHLLDSIICVDVINNVKKQKYYNDAIHKLMNKIRIELTQINSKTKLAKLAKANCLKAIKSLDPHYETEVKKNIR